MIVAQSVSTIVMLSDGGEGESECQCYWPIDVMNYDCIQVKFHSEECNKFYKQRTFNVVNTKVK